MVHNHSATHVPNSCQICANRESDLSKPHEASAPLPLLIIILHFKTALTTKFSAAIPSSPLYTALQQTLTSITSNAETIYHPTHFTSWSPALDDGSIVIILTTAASETTTTTSPLFTPLTTFLSKPPFLSSFKFPHSITTLAAPYPTPSIPLDLILLHAPNNSVAVEIGKKFGWDPKRSSLAETINHTEPGMSFPRLGDLVRDFFAWADWTSEDASSTKSVKDDAKSGDHSTKRLTLNDAATTPDKNPDTDSAQETLLLLFQWSSISAAGRFKNPDLKSYGVNGRSIDQELWDKRIARPVQEMQDVGARVETFRVELRGVEASGEKKTAGKKSRRLSVMAAGFGERISGLWR